MSADSSVETETETQTQPETPTDSETSTDRESTDDDSVPGSEDKCEGDDCTLDATIAEESNEDLLAEILAEEQAEEQARLESIANGTLPSDDLNDMSWKNETHEAQQLTQFQESIITTGSQVSYFLLALLFILFVIQSIRKGYKAWMKQRKLAEVASVLDEGEARRAEEFTPFSDVAAKTYAVYNTTLEHRDEYYDKVREGASDDELQPLLLRRAFDCIDRYSTIQRDGPGIRKNWTLDLLPKAVWDDFNAAQSTIQHEIDEVQKENMRRQFHWGAQYGSEIFACAREQFSAYVQQQKMRYSQRMAAARQQQMQGRMGPGGPSGGGPNRVAGGGQPRPMPGPGPSSKTQIPDAKGFGSGLKRGFLNNPPPKEKKKLTRRQQKREKQKMLAEEQRRKEMAGEGVTDQTGTADMISDFTQQSGGQPEQPSQTQVRKRKGRRRFAKK